MSHNQDEYQDGLPTDSSRVSRRWWMIGTGAAVVAAGAAKVAWDRNERFQRAATAILRASSYDSSLVDLIRRGLVELGFDRRMVRKKSILLKPNLVEPTRNAPHVNTHPLLVRAVAEVFRSWDAGEVLVGEGPGHVRDTSLVLEQSGFDVMLDEAGLRFVDLNLDDVEPVQVSSGFTGLRQLYLPRTVCRADWIVSLPKMKTHHWAGVTMSMKNLFGVIPGICYGWPKNVLHQRGIDQSILDINHTVKPRLAIVDGIVGMEGDGPIMGAPRASGVLVMGTNLPAVDATGTRLMGLDPRRINYLMLASGLLGPIRRQHIEQRGETIQSCAQPFRVLDSMAHLKL